MMRQVRWLATAALAGVLAVGCASGGSDRTRTDMNRLTSEELSSIQVGSLHDAISRLRPRWLQVRSARSLAGSDTEIVVYQGQTRLGGPEVLRQMLPASVVWIEYLDAATATSTLPGVGTHVQGAIVLHMSPPRR
jgi:hypothetical protein